MAIYCETALRLRLIATAQELAAPDLLVRGGRVWNAYTGEILTADIAICGDRIAKVGKWAGPLGDATEVVEADGHIAVPGYIEPHTHPWPFGNPLSLGEIAVCRGTTCLVYDQLMLSLAMGRIDSLRSPRRFPRLHCPTFFGLPASPRSRGLVTRIGSLGLLSFAANSKASSIWAQPK